MDFECDLDVRKILVLVPGQCSVDCTAFQHLRGIPQCPPMASHSLTHRWAAAAMLGAVSVLPNDTTAGWDGAGFEPPVPAPVAPPVKVILYSQLAGCVFFSDLRQELAVRERQSDVSRMSAPSSPTQDGVKNDSAVQASLSLPATPLCKTLDNAFANQTGR